MADWMVSAMNAEPLSLLSTRGDPCSASSWRRIGSTVSAFSSATGCQVTPVQTVVVGVLAAVRVYWRLTGIRPGFLTSNDNFERAARVSHGALYACMIIQPITGYLGTFRDADYLGVTNFGDTAMFAWVAATFDTTWEAWEAPMDFVHRSVLGSKLIWMLLVIETSLASESGARRRAGVTLRRRSGGGAGRPRTENLM